jgi:hypothetical protein
MGLPLCISTDLSLLHWSSFSYQSQSPEGSFTNKCVEDDDSFFLLLNKDEMAPIDILCKALQSTVPHILSEEKTNSYINDVGKCRELNFKYRYNHKQLNNNFYVLYFGKR